MQLTRRRRNPTALRAGRRVIVLATVVAFGTVGCGTGRSGWTFPPIPTPSVTSPQPLDQPSSTPIAAATPDPSRQPAVSTSPSPGPTPGGTRSLLPPTPVGSVPILYYHRVVAPPADYADWSTARRRKFLTYDVIPAAFAAQLDWLTDHGYTTILPRDLADHWDLGTALPDRPVIITFDDGSHDWISRVLPMLKRRGMVAEFYLTLDAIAHGNLTWAEVRRLAAAGNGIGAHDVHHVQLTALGYGRHRASAATMWAEINDARTTIGQHTGVVPDSMAYVGGGFDARLERLVQKAGYTSARSIRRGIAQDASRRYQLRVVRIGVHDDVVDLVGAVIDPDLPTFAARMRGVSDLAPR